MRQVGDVEKGKDAFGHGMWDILVDFCDCSLSRVGRSQGAENQGEKTGKDLIRKKGHILKNIVSHAQ